MAVDIDTILNELVAAGVISGRQTKYRELHGGVSSSIYLVEEAECKVVVKQALARLRVKDIWQVDVSRNRVEQQFIQLVSSFLPQTMPRILYCSENQNYFVMEYLDGYQDWKSQLLAGKASPDLAREAGRIIGTLHHHTWGDRALAERFDTFKNFHALRVDPYLLTTASRHPALAEKFHSETMRLKRSRKCLIHGDYSPKNIMIGRNKMKLLDCEVACYGEPTFDMAFLLNHFFLKALFHSGKHRPFLELVPLAWNSYMSCFDSFEQNAEQHTSRLLLMLLLARVDGKSPVEYIEDETRRGAIRSFVYEQLTQETFFLNEICTLWQRHLDDIHAHQKHRSIPDL